MTYTCFFLSKTGGGKLAATSHGDAAHVLHGRGRSIRSEKRSGPRVRFSLPGRSQPDCVANVCEVVKGFLQSLCEVTSYECMSFAHVCFNARMILAGAGDSLQSCWRRESQRFDSSVWAVC